MNILKWVPYQKPTLLVTVLAILLPLCIPLIQMNIFSHLWKEYNRVINRKTCSCSCWDTVFKGTYESGISGYKHMYFNATPQAAKMWILTVTFIIALYESMKYLIQLFHRKELRYSMFVLFASVVYSHYYSFWAYINYYNDDFYSQFYHQLFFSVTELCSTTMVLQLANVNVDLTTNKLLIILNIALIHVLIAGWDQFVTNVIQGGGQLHQVMRDLLFMIPDILHIAVSLNQFHQLSTLKHVPVTHLISKKQYLWSLILISALWFLCFLL